MLTAAQIVTQACIICKATGFTSFGGVALNLVLQDLVLHRDLKVNREVETITVSSGTNGPFNMASRYLRTYDLFFQQNGLPFFLLPISTQQYDQEFKDPSIANYPYEFMTDLTPLAASPESGVPLLYIYPQSSGSISLTHRYMIRRAEITNPESSSTVPWFADQDYLIHATAIRLMKVTDDQRYDKFVVDAEEMLRTHLLIGDGDEQQVVKEVRLDARRFRLRRSLPPTKLTD